MPKAPEGRARISRAPVYVAKRRFGPAAGEAWQRYLAWSGLHHLREVVTLDTTLCPTVPAELTPDDWRHNVAADYQTGYFHSLEYLRSRVANESGVDILAVLQNPSSAELECVTLPGFDLLGYDVLDVHGDISALTNCGGWDGLVPGRELSSAGLLSELGQADQVREALRVEHPGESHADCDVWAVWRMGASRDETR
jgi:hypothetical protein